MNPTGMLDLPNDIMQLIFSMLGDACSTCVDLGSLQACCTRLRNAVFCAETLWKALATQCYPEIPALQTRTALCKQIGLWKSYVAHLEQPTMEQMVSCVVRSATAHSYYKHLDLSRTTLFYFHVSLVAGMRKFRSTGSTLVLDEYDNAQRQTSRRRRTRRDHDRRDHDRRSEYVDYVRGDGTEFHYTWIPTEEYRSKFGFLGGGEKQNSLDMESILLDTPTKLGAARMPAYITASGTTFCSAIVHGSSHGLYHKAFEVFINKGREALEAEQAEGNVCDATIQRRHYNSLITMPADVIDAFEILHHWRGPLLEFWHNAQLDLTHGAHPLTHNARRDILYNLVSTLSSRRCNDPVPPRLQPIIDAIKKMGAALFPFLQSEARTVAVVAATDKVVRSLAASYDHELQVPSISDYVRVAEFAQCARERYAMLEAVARICRHIWGAGKVDLKSFHQNRQLAGKLLVIPALLSEQIEVVF